MQSTAPMRRARSVDSCRTAASACITKTLWTSTAALASARAWWLRGDRQFGISHRWARVVNSTVFCRTAASQSAPTSTQALPWFRLASCELSALGGRGYDWKTAGRDEVFIFLAGDRRTARCAGAGRKTGPTLGSQAYKKCRALLEDKMSIENDVPRDRSYANTRGR